VLPGGASAARISVSGSTSVNWSEPTTVQDAGKKRGAILVTAALVLVAGAAVAVFLALRPGRSPAPAVAPQGSVAEAPPTASGPLVLSPEPFPGASASAVPSATTTAPATAAITTSPVSPVTPVTPGKQPSKPPPAGTSTGDEPPRYRTNW
jgi:hypothetical protein